MKAALRLCVAMLVSAYAQPGALAAEANYLSDDELNRLAADSPQRLVQVAIVWNRDATLEEASDLSSSFGIDFLQIVTRRNNSVRTGDSAIVMFSSQHSPSSEQLARARCLQAVPQGTFTEIDLHATPSDQLGRWRLDDAMGVMRAADAQRLKEGAPRFVAAIAIRREPIADVSALVDAALSTLSRKTLVFATEIPQSCVRYLQAVPLPQSRP